MPDFTTFLANLDQLRQDAATLAGESASEVSAEKQRADAAVAAQVTLQQQLTDCLNRPVPGPVPQPVPTPGTEPMLPGINATSGTDHSAMLARFGPRALAWRYYHQPGEQMTWPSEYALRSTPPDEFILSNKVLPKNMHSPHVRHNPELYVPPRDLLLPAAMTTASMVDQMKAAPKDRKTRITPWHEPEDDIAKGAFTAQELDDAFGRMRQAQQQVGPHIVICVISMGYDWQKSSKRNPEDYIPPDPFWDELLVDMYFDGVIGGPVSGIPKAYDGVIATAKKHGKKWGVAECGVGHKVTGQARVDALSTLGKTITDKGATVGCYFWRGQASDDWALNSQAELDAWNKSVAV